MPNRVLPRRELFFVVGKAARGKWRKMKWKVSIMTRWSTYRLIINSQMPLNVNFFCGDWRIAIVTEEWKVIELFLILSIAARGENYSARCSCRAAWRPKKIPRTAAAVFPKFSPPPLWQFRSFSCLHFCLWQATRKILLYSGGSAWLLSDTCPQFQNLALTNNYSTWRVSVLVRSWLTNVGVVSSYENVFESTPKFVSNFPKIL